MHVGSDVAHYVLKNISLDVIFDIISKTPLQGLWPLVLPCATLKAGWFWKLKVMECLPWLFKDGTQDVQYRHGHQRCRKALNMFQTIIRSSKKMLVTQCLPTWGGQDTHALPWLQNHASACTMVGQWSPNNKCVLLQTVSLNLGDDCLHFYLPDASFGVPIECVLNDIYGGHCASIRRALKSVSHWTTVQWFCPLLPPYERTAVPLRQFCWFKGGTMVARAVVQRQNLWF